MTAKQAVLGVDGPFFINELNFDFKIFSQQAEVAKLVAEAELILRDGGLSSEQTIEVCLVLAEALNNVVEHGYCFANDGEIDVGLMLSDNTLLISIKDFGLEYTIPVSRKNAPSDASELAALPEGGFGWGLIQTLTDEVALRRDGGRNHLKLKKFLELPWKKE